MKRALIIGCGYTGSRLASRLLQEGFDVVGTSASGAPVPGVRIRTLDLLAEASWTLPEAAGAVVYYMVSTLFRRYDRASQPHLAPLARVFAACAVHRPRGLVYLSSTSVYGDRDGAWVDEATPLTPHSPWGEMRRDLEQLALSFGRAQGLPACVARLPEIYGPGRGPIARLRQGYRLRFPERFSNRIHIEDLVEVLAALGQRLDQELLLVADDCPALSREVYALAARLLGQPPPPLDLQPVADPNRLALLRDSKRCDNRRLRSWLTQPLRYPTYREGLAQTL